MPPEFIISIRRFRRRINSRLSIRLQTYCRFLEMR
jgi:hypothetical protein